MPSPKIDKFSLVINMRGKKRVFFALVGNNFLPKETTLEVTRLNTTKPWPSGILRGHSSSHQLVCWLKYSDREKAPAGQDDRETEDLVFTVTNPDFPPVPFPAPEIPILDEDP